MSSSTLVGPRPSDARRAALREAEGDVMGGDSRGVPMVSNFFPVERYCAAADKVLASFRNAYSNKRLDEAYVLGKRFATFSMEALPQHNYYKSHKMTSWRIKNKQDMARVVKQLEEVVQWMDQEELLRQKLVEKQREEERRRYEELKLKVEQKKRERMELSALSKLQLLMAPTRPPAEAQKQQQQPQPQQQQQRREDLSESSLDLGAALQRREHEDLQASQSTQDGSLVLSDLLRMKRDSNRSSRGESWTIQPSASTDESQPTPPTYSDSLSSVEIALAKLSEPKSSGHGQNGGVGNDSVASSGKSSSRRLVGSDEPLPPPMPPPPSEGSSSTLPPPPSYSQVMSSTSKPAQDQLPHANRSYDLGESNGLYRRSIAAPAGGAHVLPPPVPVSYHLPFIDVGFEKVPVAPTAVEKIPFDKLRNNAISQYQKLRQNDRIHVFGLDTYQGRLPQSTNGCTVISPLVVSHHLKSTCGVADATIVDVIDRQCGPILRDIRGKLGLEGNSLIIPSDVHDYLVDRKILSQSKFAGVSGGNILDKKHIGEFLKLLDSGEKGAHSQKRSGAALFFKEHVVSIVKVPKSGGTFCFDLVDSMPGVVSPTSDKRRATRTRCRDLAAFEALLQWYACGKFSDSNANYIDHNAWDENMADFDPRVFQAFVWAE